MPDERHRLVVLGSSRVGKTSIIRQFLNKEFSEKYKETVEDIYSKRIKIQVKLFVVFFLLVFENTDLGICTLAFS